MIEKTRRNTTRLTPNLTQVLTSEVALFVLSSPKSSSKRRSHVLSSVSVAVVGASVLALTPACGDSDPEGSQKGGNAGTGAQAGTGGNSAGTAGQSGNAGTNAGATGGSGGSSAASGSSGSGGFTAGSSGASGSGGSGNGGSGGNAGEAGTGGLGATAGTGGSGGNLLNNGQACDTTEQCQSGFCVDGVCCESACTDTCFSCSKTSTDQADGVCAPSKQGTNPHNDCTSEIGSCAGDTCDGSGACVVQQDGSVCRPSAGPCDIEEICSSGVCPADQVIAADVGSICRAAVGDCDAAETCDGSSAQCPDDQLMPPSVECRSAVGLCDAAEFCTGSSTSCPEDAIQPAGATCRTEQGACDVEDVCDGITTDCADILAANTQSCGGYLCAGDTPNCPTTCTHDTECAVANVCIAGQCVEGNRVFSTSTTHPGNIGGLAAADQICQGLANAAGLKGTYKAWLSDSQNSPVTRFSHPTIPYYLTNGVLIANSWSDLIDGTLIAPIGVNEQGIPVASNIPRTGTLFTGLPSMTTCLNWTSSSASVYGMAGFSEAIDHGWTENQPNPCNVMHRLYCFGQ